MELDASFEADLSQVGHLTMARSTNWDAPKCPSISGQALCTANSIRQNV